MLFFILIRGAICLVVCAFSLSLIDSDRLSHIFQRASWLLPQPRCRLSYAKIVQTECHESNFNGRGAAYLMQN